MCIFVAVDCKIDFQIPPEIFYAFNDLKFVEKTHQYFLDKKQLVSVTTKIHKFQHRFDTDKWSLIKAEELGISQADMIAEWERTNKKSKIKGSILHNYIEYLFNNKVYDYPRDYVMESVPLDAHDIEEEFKSIRYQIDNFYADTRGKLIPIKMEYVMYDEILGIAGMCDILFYNVKKMCFQLWDWKTNKKLRTENIHQKLKAPFDTFDDCEYVIYSFQLNLYKYILRRKLNLNLGDSYIVWFNENNSNYKIVECRDQQDIVPNFFSN